MTTILLYPVILVSCSALAKCKTRTSWFKLSTYWRIGLFPHSWPKKALKTSSLLPFLTMCWSKLIRFRVWTMSDLSYKYSSWSLSLWFYCELSSYLVSKASQLNFPKNSSFLYQIKCYCHWICFGGNKTIT